MEATETPPISYSLHENIQYILYKMGNSSDVVIREFKIGHQGQISAALFYLDGLAKTDDIHILIENLMVQSRNADLKLSAHAHPPLLSLLDHFTITVGEVHYVKSFRNVFYSLLSGDTIILFDDLDQGIVVGTRGWKDRGVTETSVETVVRGPRESFTETLRTNTTLVRRRIKDPRLWLESKQIGSVTKTDVTIMYIHGIVNEKVLGEVYKRLDRIQIDAILETANIEELIQDNTYTPFPTIYHTERPDVVAAGLLEGRVAIFVDGTPVVLLVPVVFSQFLQAAEDYYHRHYFSLFRLLRWIALFISLLGPAIYIAVTTFHQEMLPTILLINLTSQREGVPFPGAVEALIMEVTFEILREAGVRMPRMIGPAISIVGALVIGQAAVEAGLISAAIVIVVSVTAISNFTIPNIAMSIPVRILRFVLMIAAATFGIYGVFLAYILILLHLCSLRSFGVPYMAPLAPFNSAAQRDTLIRFPIWRLHTRPSFISQNSPIREQNSMPNPPKPR